MTTWREALGSIALVVVLAALVFTVRGMRDAEAAALLAERDAQVARDAALDLRRALADSTEAYNASLAALADSTDEWRARAEASEASRSAARRDAAREAAELRETLNERQSAQLDSVLALKEVEIHAVTAQLADARAEAAAQREARQRAVHLWGISQQEAANWQEAAERWEAAAGAKDQLIRDAERSALVWKGVAVVEAGAVLAALLSG